MDFGCGARRGEDARLTRRRAADEAESGLWGDLKRCVASKIMGRPVSWMLLFPAAWLQWWICMVRNSACCRDVFNGPHPWWYVVQLGSGYRHGAGGNRRGRCYVQQRLLSELGDISAGLGDSVLGRGADGEALYKFAFTFAASYKSPNIVSYKSLVECELRV